MSETQLSADELERLADLVAERVARLMTAPEYGALAYTDANGIAARFGVSRAFVYEHASELGAVRLGTGSRPRLRFDETRVAAYFEARSAKAAQAAKPARESTRRVWRRQARSRAPGLLPIHGSVDSVS